jgi:very-short-patch-repair endonuclease
VSQVSQVSPRLVSASTALRCCGCGQQTGSSSTAVLPTLVLAPPAPDAAGMTAHLGPPEGGPRPWQQVVADQDGVLTRQQALHGGVSEDQWQWRLDADRWQPLCRGVVVTHTGPVTLRQQSWAAVLVAGRGACLSGDAALVELGLGVGPLRVLHVAVPYGRTVTPRVLAPHGGSPVRVQPRRVTGLAALRHPVRRPPTVRAAPAVLHAAAWAGSDRAAEWRIAAAVQQRLVLPQDLRSTLASLPRLPRRPLIATVLDDVEQGAHAASELHLLRFLREWRLPPPDQLQRPVRLGRIRYLDAWWRRQRVAAELDGAHHRTAGAWDDDVLRANDVLVAGRHDGTVLLRFTTANLRHDGARVAAQLAAVLL